MCNAGFVHIGVEELGNLNCRWDDTEAATRTFRQKAEEVCKPLLARAGVLAMLHWYCALRPLMKIVDRLGARRTCLGVWQ